MAIGMAGVIALILVSSIICLLILVIGCSYMRQKTSRSREERAAHRRRITQLSNDFNEDLQ